MPMEGHPLSNDFWLRSVAAEPHEKYSGRHWKLWQFTTTGRVPGIKGPVDRNAFSGSRADWNRYLALNGVGGARVASLDDGAASNAD